MWTNSEGFNTIERVDENDISSGSACYIMSFLKLWVLTSLIVTESMKRIDTILTGNTTLEADSCLVPDYSIAPLFYVNQPSLV